MLKTTHANPAAPTLQARKQEVVRDAIWDAAVDLFVEKGYDETTVEDIAQAAGISRRSFFRYFSSKSDLMAQGIVNYGDYLTEAIAACPPGCPLAEVFRRTVTQVAEMSAAKARTKKIMQVALTYPAAKEAQISRMAELQERLAGAFARRCRESGEADLMPGILAGLTLSFLGVTFRAWFEHGQQDISATVNEVFATLARLMCAETAGRPGLEKRRGQRSPKT